MNSEQEDYSDIINTDYPFDMPYPRMSINDRAAQFSSFAALSGFEDEIGETERETDSKIDLDESEIVSLDMKLQLIRETIDSSEQPMVRIVYFVPDEKKAGGKYVSLPAKIKKIDEINKTLQTDTNMVIHICDIYRLEGELFDQAQI